MHLGVVKIAREENQGICCAWFVGVLCPCFRRSTAMCVLSITSCYVVVKRIQSRGALNVAGGTAFLRESLSDGEELQPNPVPGGVSQRFCACN
eukprot:5107684-Amphidinium_carterae.1